MPTARLLPEPPVSANNDEWRRRPPRDEPCQSIDYVKRPPSAPTGRRRRPNHLASLPAIPDDPTEAVSVAEGALKLAARTQGTARPRHDDFYIITAWLMKGMDQ